MCKRAAPKRIRPSIEISLFCCFCVEKRNVYLCSAVRLVHSILDIQLQQSSPIEATLSVTVSAEDYQLPLKKRIKAYCKKARIPGFRQGQVPEAHVLRLYGKSLLLEEINELLQKSLTKYINQQQLKTLGDPLLERADTLGQPEENLNYTFTYQLGLQAEVSLKDTEKISLLRYKIQPEEKDLDEFVENIRYRFGKVTHPQRVDTPDVLLIGQLHLPEGKQEELALPCKHMLPEQWVRFEGISPPHTFHLQLSTLYSQAHQPATLLRLQKEGIDSHQSYPFLLQRLDLPEKAPLSEELFAKMYGPRQIKNREDFLVRSRGYLLQQYEMQSRRLLHTQLKERFIKDFGPPLPEAYLRRRFQLNIPKDQKIDETMFESALTRYQAELRWRMLQSSVAEENQIVISPQALRQEVEQLLLRQAQIYGEPTFEQREQIQPFVQKFLSKKSNTESIYVQMQEEKILSFLETKIRTQEKTITPTAFWELQNETS